ncbi:hypothetical protein K469DRAFT_812200 [Zopfia rhizophila CBS 207.26]|uniref:Nephrocystin 3-like N-terminal domain-containing protein n=1 Tax=Zopfia rhizophila CBS 207.26 TaxID=1314779 RepID=A0A6A6DBM4_9PEZI|nr:hypothetical protein K469DRAFT_812200 [Zopfia rhizophila CBS 207.26]
MCLQNTQVDVLKEIRAWADGPDKRCIYWLNGLAGTGKSTMARTIAREYFERGRFGASFFFLKGGGDVGHAGKFPTTIAFQLAEKSPCLKSYICGAVSENNDIKDQSLRDQWHQLILQPLSRIDGNSSRSSYILVVDALDKCEGESDIWVILLLLAEAQSLKTVQLQNFVLHNISPSIVDHDIRIFVEYNFKLIGRERSLDAGWPGEQIIKRLIQNASGLFIWAATACRFVRDGKRFAVKRLAMILEDSVDFASAPEKHLNEIYVTVLKQSIGSDYTDEEREDLYSTGP